MRKTLLSSFVQLKLTFFFSMVLSLAYGQNCLAPTVKCGTSTLSSVEFTWANVPSATGYDVSYKINRGTAITVTGVSSPYNVNGLQMGSTVELTVTPTGTGCFNSGFGSCTAQSCTAPSITADPLGKASCEGSAVTYSVMAVGESGYQWQESKDDGATFKDITNGGVYNGATSSTLTISNNTGLNGNLYRVVVKEPNDLCPINSSLAGLIVNPSPALTINNPVGVCSPNTVDITLPEITSGTTGAETFTYWEDAAANKPIVDATKIGVSGTYYIRAENGTCTDIEPVIVSIMNLPQKIVIDSVPPLCGMASPVTLVASPSGGVWSGLGITDTVAGTFDPAKALEGSNTITYTVPGNCGGSATINIVVEFNIGDPIGPFTIADCEGASIDLNGLFMKPDTTLVWYDETNGDKIVDSKITISAGSIAYYIKLNGGACNPNARVYVVVTGTPKTNVSLADFTTVCDTVQTLKLLGGFPNDGSFFGLGVTNNSFSPSTQGVGTYSISYALSFCSDTVTKVLTVEKCAVSGLPSLENKQFKLYPNPANSKVEITFNEALLVGQKMNLFSYSGKLIEQHEIKNKLIVLDVSSFERGIYFIEVGDSREKLIIE